MHLTNIYMRSGEYPTLVITGELYDGMRFTASHVMLPLESVYVIERRDRELLNFELIQLEDAISERRRSMGYPNQMLELQGVAA